MYRIRFFLLLLQCLLTRTQGLLEDFKVSFLALPFIDTDVSRLFTQTYATYMGLCRWHFVFHSEFRNLALKKAWVPVTASETMEYKRSIKAFSRVQVTTKLLCWNEKRFYLEQTFSVKGNVHARAYLEGLIRGPKGHLKPPEVFKELGVEQDSPPMPEYLKLWISSKEACPQ